jgi:3-deoxy-manno-octulosonate cytidylyltransferase (CMP-KDO synthetase)
MSKTTVVGIIPARYGSSRLPGKALKTIGGLPTIQRVYERTRCAKILDEVYVATDDERIADVIRACGGRTILTSPEHPSGTDRIAEAIQTVDADIVVNVQGDQPFIDPDMIEEAVQPLLDEPDLPMATIVHPIEREKDLQDPNVVKAVADIHGNALYFSRSLLPYPREAVPHAVYEHVGLYVYRRDFLLKLAALPFRVRLVVTKCRDNGFSGFSVDTAEDLLRAEALLVERGLL